MKRSNWQFVMALAVCTLLPAFAAQAKAHVPRPLEMQAHSQQVWQVVRVDDEWIPVELLSAEAWGVSTRCGPCYMALSGPPSPEGIVKGFITSANGDEISWVSTLADITHSTITGGTGRFAGATGKFTVTILTQEASVDPDAGTMTIKFTWTASGTITC